MEYKITEEDVEFIKKSLNRAFIFSSLTEEQKRLVVRNMELYSVKRGELVFKQGA